MFRSQCDPHAGAYLHAISGQLERFCDDLANSRSKSDRCRPLAVAFGLDDSELVAAKPGQDVGVAQRRA
jgi:hypothetical protein